MFGKDPDGHSPRGSNKKERRVFTMRTSCRGIFSGCTGAQKTDFLGEHQPKI